MTRVSLNKTGGTQVIIRSYKEGTIRNIKLARAKKQ